MRLELLVICAAIPAIACAQLENAAFTETGRGAATAFVTDYQALGINPANIAFGNEYKKKFTLSLGQFGFSNYAEGLTRKQLSDAIKNTDEELSVDEQFLAAQQFTDTRLAMTLNVTALGFAINTKKAGNFAFSMGAKFSHFSVFNNNASDHLWRGYADPYFDQWIVPGENGNDTIPNGGSNSADLENVILGFSSNPGEGSQLYDGTVIRDLAYAEYNFGYGRSLFSNEKYSVYGGVGVKYLQGYYLLDLTIENGSVAQAFTASTPGLNIEYGSVAATSPSAISGENWESIGDGFGFDLGLAFELNDKLRISASVTDIGSITFDGNVYQTKDTLIYDLESLGLTSYNVFNEFDVFSGDDGLFQWEGIKEKKVKLPTQFRLGLAYFLSPKIRLGLDVAAPFNDEPGNIQNLAFAAGLDFIPAAFFRVSAGIGAGDNYDFRIPFGLNFAIGEGTWEFGISSRDMLYFVRDDKPNLSIAAGFLRFRFGQMTEGSPSRLFS